jgi:hypothetical protein
MAHLLAVVVASAIASDCAGLRCVFAGNTTWAGDGLQATLSIDPAAASDASGRAPATLQLSGTGGTHVLAGRAAWDASAREMLVEAEDGSWLALSSAVAPTTLLLHLGGFPAAPALTGSVHALDWQRPLPRGELANFAAAAAALGRGDAFVAGSLGGMGGSVLIQSLEDGSCLLSGEPSALNDASPNGQSRVDRPLLGPCDAAEALWTVGAGSSRGVRSLASIRSTCLRRRTLSRSRKPLTLGSCGSRGSRRWSVLHSGHLASARLLPNNSLGRLIGNWTRQPAQFCLRVSRPSDAAAARAWASCHARPACRAQGLVGACCPTEDGDFLPCCNATAPPVEAGLETAPCDAAGGFLLRVLPAPGLAPRAAMGGGAGGVAGKEEGGRAAGKQGGRESDALSDGQFAMLRAALEPASRRQLATGGDSRGTLAALLAGVPGLAGQGGWGAGSQAVVPWARFVEAVVSSQRSALAAADAAAGAAKAAAAAATHNASSTAADIGRRLAEAEAKAVAEAAARSAAENRLAEASRAAAANGAELAEAAQREEELRAAAARAKAYAESLAERTAAAERESLAASARVGEVEAQVDGAQHACNATRDRLAEIEAEVITARAAARKAEAALAIAAAEADGASRHEGTAREQVLEAVGRAAACEARVADEWRSQADCEAAGVAREVAEARLLRLTEKARADADSLRECRAAEAGHAQVAADATACAEARQALTTEVSLLRASLGARGEALAAAMASEAQAVSAAGVAQVRAAVFCCNFPFAPPSHNLPRPPRPHVIAVLCAEPPPLILASGEGAGGCLTA